MKIQIDTDKRIIKLESSSNLGKLIVFLKKILPNEWSSYTLETNTIIKWESPIVYKETRDWGQGDWAKRTWLCQTTNTAGAGHYSNNSKLTYDDYTNKFEGKLKGLVNLEVEEEI